MDGEIYSNKERRGKKGEDKNGNEGPLPGRDLSKKH